MNSESRFAGAQAKIALFVKSAGVVLGLTGLAKAFSAIGAARALDAIDPLIGIPFRLLLLAVGLIELCIALG
jgi:hypothetical protein